MIKCSKHILKYQNKSKNTLLHQIFIDYTRCLEYYIFLIKEGKLPLQNFCSSKTLPVFSNIEKSHWRESCYIQASGIIRSNLKFSQNKTYKRYQKVYAYFSKRNRQLKFLNTRAKDLNINYLKRIKINIKDTSIDLKYQNFDIKEAQSFDGFIRIITPYKSGSRYINFKLPFKEHKHSLKYKNWKLLTSVRLEKNQKNQIFLCKLYEQDLSIKRTEGSNIGFDCGYKKLLSDSNGNHYGTELNDIYHKLARKQRNSKNFKQLLQHKKNEINRVANNLNLNGVQTVVVEDLKQVKYKTKLSTKTMNKMQYWSYKQVLDKLEDRSNLEGFYIVRVNPAYTSQTCCSCNTIDKSSRKGELYHCNACGLEIDADTNGAINILHRGI